MISVIMGVYNIGNKDILRTSIDSILNQTYKNFEFIICDDGSNDNTYKVLQCIAQKDKRIKLLRNNINLKAGVARNRCLKEAKGEFIAIMDADDYSAPERLEKQKNFLIKNAEFDFVGCKGKYFNKKINDTNDEYWFCKYPKPKDFLVTLPFVHASIMFKKESLLKVSGYSTSKKVMRSEDYDLLMKLYVNGCKGANISNTLYYIRQDKNTFKRRKYRYRINESIVKYKGFKALKLMPIGIVFVIKPLIVGLIPIKLLNKIKKIYYTKKEGDKLINEQI
ncbi:glycosyltransferase EpsE [Clostridium sp. CTA-5]